MLNKQLEEGVFFASAEHHLEKSFFFAFHPASSWTPCLVGQDATWKLYFWIHLALAFIEISLYHHQFTPRHHHNLCAYLPKHIGFCCFPPFKKNLSAIQKRRKTTKKIIPDHQPATQALKHSEAKSCKKPMQRGPKNPRKKGGFRFISTDEGFFHLLKVE